jgi:hypothetical protein
LAIGVVLFGRYRGGLKDRIAGKRYALGIGKACKRQ